MEHRDLKIDLGQIVTLTVDGLAISTIEEAGVYYAIPKQEVEAGKYNVKMYYKRAKDTEWETLTSTLEVLQPMELMYVNLTKGHFLSVCFDLDTDETEATPVAPKAPTLAKPVSPSPKASPAPKIAPAPKLEQPAPPAPKPVPAPKPEAQPPVQAPKPSSPAGLKVPSPSKLKVPGK